MFIGGLNYNTTEDGLKEHFGQFGEIVDVVVMKFPDTKRYVRIKGRKVYTPKLQIRRGQLSLGSRTGLLKIMCCSIPADGVSFENSCTGGTQVHLALT